MAELGLVGELSGHAGAVLLAGAADLDGAVAAGPLHRAAPG